MDVHTDAIAVASVAQDHGAQVTSLGAIGTRQCAIDHMIRTMQSKATHLRFIDDAGPCGSWLSRSLTKKSYDCWVVAPSLIPPKPGDRVTPDRRDAGQLARLARSGDLTPVYVPTVEEAAMRERSRAREDTLSDGKDATLRLTACVLRHAIRYPGRANGGPAHLRWLSDVVCLTPAHHSVCQAYVRAVSDHSDRLQRLEQALHEHVKTWRLSPVVEALQALRGVQCTVAVPLVAEMRDRTRFETPRELRKFLGLLPSEHTSGAKRRQGSMTKAGNSQARRVLVEGAWASRSPAQVRRHVHLRLETQPTVIQDSRGKAQVRRCKRSRRRGARGKHSTVVTVAIARELTGFLGAMAKEGPITPYNQDGS